MVSFLVVSADDRTRSQLAEWPVGPSNRATVQFVCESALGLALSADALPGGPGRGGILTPATGLGDVLADRLRKAGTRIEVGA